MKKNILFILLIIIIYLFIINNKLVVNSIFDVYGDLIENNLRDGKYIEAEHLYLNEIKLYNQFRLFNEYQLNYDKLYTELILFYINQRMYDKAEFFLLEKIKNPYSSKTIKDISFIKPDSEINFMSALNDLAEIALYNNLDKVSYYINGSRYYMSKIENINDISIVEENARSFSILGLKSLKSNDSKNAKLYFNKARNILVKNKQYENIGDEFLFDYYYNLSLYYQNKKDYSKALFYGEKMYSSIPSYPLPVASESAYYSQYLSLINKNIGNIYIKQKNFKSAKNLFLKSYLLDKENYGEYSSQVLCDTYNLSKLYKLTNDEYRTKLYSEKTVDLAQKFIILQNINIKNMENKMEQFCNVKERRIDQCQIKIPK